MRAKQATQGSEAAVSASGRGLRGQEGRARLNNLPLPLSSFVGRAEAIAKVRQLLARTRLLTLSGSGGVGKTRLALEVASGLLDQFGDGVWWVDLASLCDAELVAHTVALALALADDPTQSKIVTLRNYLRDKDLLLVLDNCEHVVAECAELAWQTLPYCPRLRIMATSREPLRVEGEIVWSVPPLSLPCIEGTPSPEHLAQSEAFQLFLERARASRPDLLVKDGMIQAIADVCCRLEGIPLAIELAAARVQVLSVPQIAAHLDDLFRLLAEGGRSAPPRHQTIQATIEWSYDLLTGPEQRLFERLAVFGARFGLEAAMAMANNPPGSEGIRSADVLDLLAHLALKSLIVVGEGEQARYWMLETIRQYALMRLSASGELEQIRQRHLAYYLDLAERAESKLLGEEQVEWLKLLEDEHDNLRAALLWSLEGESREAGLRLAAALAAFWLRVGYLTEGSNWLERALAASPEAGPVRNKALYQAGRLAHQRGDYNQALVFGRQSLAMSHGLGDSRGMARALGLMGWVTHAQGDRDGACTLLEEGLSLARESGDERTVARTLLLLGDLRLRQGALEEAATLLQEGRQLYERMADRWGMALALWGLGQVARRQGDQPRAVANLQLSLVLFHELGSKPEIAYPLEALALTAADQGRFQRAAHLWGAASAVRSSVHAPLEPSYEVDHAPSLERAQAAMGQDRFALAWAEGRELTLAQALALAIEDTPPAESADMALSSPASQPSPPPQPRLYQHGLTPREVEVLRLVASGLTDVQVAEALVISARTVGKHLQSIYAKLDLPSRSAATRWAIEHRLN